MCGLSYVSDYIDPTGHNWDEGHSVTSSTCTADGVIEYHCTNAGCKEKMIKAESATGHTPGKAATCTEPQTCEKCGTVLALPKGHRYSKNIVMPTCTAMGYTEYKCDNCDDNYIGDYTDKAEHDYKKSVTAPSCTAMGYTTYTCKNCDDEFISCLLYTSLLTPKETVTVRSLQIFYQPLTNKQRWIPKHLKQGFGICLSWTL